MTLPDFLIHQADGEIVIAGHRVTIVDILQGYREGRSAEQIAAEFPPVPLATVHKAINCYLEGKTDFDEYLDRYLIDLDSAQKNGKYVPPMTELRHRIAAAKRKRTRGQTKSVG